MALAILLIENQKSLNILAVQGYCKGELIEMDSVAIEEVKRQHKKPYQHGKINATAN